MDGEEKLIATIVCSVCVVAATVLCSIVWANSLEARRAFEAGYEQRQNPGSGTWLWVKPESK